MLKHLLAGPPVTFYRLREDAELKQDDQGETEMTTTQDSQQRNFRNHC